MQHESESGTNPSARASGRGAGRSTGDAPARGRRPGRAPLADADDTADDEGAHAAEALDPSFDDDLVITPPDAALAPDVHDEVDDDLVDDTGDEDGFEDDASGLRLSQRAADLAGAALLGAAIGAGLGLLAHRATQGSAHPGRRLPAVVRRRQVEVDEMLHDEDSRPRRLAARAEADVQARLAGLADTVGDAVRSLADLRESMERTVGRELRALKRAARRRR